MPEDHPQRQRLAAYALLDRVGADGAPEILLARLAPRVRVGHWTLPGGGVDHGEHPRDALRREIYEEAGLHADPGQLLDVAHSHFVGVRPADGVKEDFHGVGLVFRARVRPESVGVEPHVVDVDGSTDLVRWVPLREVQQLRAAGRLTRAAQLALAIFCEERAAGPVDAGPRPA